MKKLLVLGLLFASLFLAGCVEQSGTSLTALPASGAAVCSTDFAPVCGSDGQTYYNACNAEQVGVTVVSTGGCITGGSGGYGYWSP